MTLFLLVIIGEVYEPQTRRTVGKSAYLTAISPSQDHQVNFNGGFQIVPIPLSSTGVNFATLNNFAKKIQSSENGEYKVVVFTKVGRYNMGAVHPSWRQDISSLQHFG
jgi:hypothetical protein